MEGRRIQVIRYVLLYLSCMSILLFVMLGVDKYRAKHYRWRIRESTLIWLAALGGALGGCLGMLVFRHKTRKNRFIWLFPLLLLVQIVVVVVNFRLGILNY